MGNAAGVRSDWQSKKTEPRPLTMVRWSAQSKQIEFRSSGCWRAKASAIARSGESGVGEVGGMGGFRFKRCEWGTCSLPFRRAVPRFPAMQKSWGSLSGRQPLWKTRLFLCQASVSRTQCQTAIGFPQRSNSLPNGRPLNLESTDSLLSFKLFNRTLQVVQGQPVLPQNASHHPADMLASAAALAAGHAHRRHGYARCNRCASWLRTPRSHGATRRPLFANGRGRYGHR